DPAGPRISLVLTDQGDDPLIVVLVGEGHGGAEPDTRLVRLLRRIGDLRLLHPPGEEVDPAVHLAEAAAAILIVRIFRAVAVRRRPGDRLQQLRPLAPEQGLIFLTQLPEALGRDVIGSLGHWTALRGPPAHCDVLIGADRIPRNAV